MTPNRNLFNCSPDKPPAEESAGKEEFKSIEAPLSQRFEDNGSSIFTKEDVPKKQRRLKNDRKEVKMSEKSTLPSGIKAFERKSSAGVLISPGKDDDKMKRFAIPVRKTPLGSPRMAGTPKNHSFVSSSQSH